MALINCSSNFRVFLKTLFYFVTVNFLLFGIAALVVGILNHKYYINISTVPQFFHVIPIIIIVIGTFITILSATAFFGVVCENRCLIKICCGLAIFALLVELFIGIGLFVFYNEKTLAENLKTSLQYYDKEKDVKKFWDVIDNYLECCGVNSTEDWGDNIPNSCCKDLDINDVCHKEQAYEKPCLGEMVKLFKEKAPVIFSATGAVQILYILLAFCSSCPRHYESL